MLVLLLSFANYIIGGICFPWITHTHKLEAEFFIKKKRDGRRTKHYEKFRKVQLLKRNSEEYKFFPGQRHPWRDFKSHSCAINALFMWSHLPFWYTHMHMRTNKNSRRQMNSYGILPQRDVSWSCSSKLHWIHNSYLNLLTPTVYFGN